MNTTHIACVDLGGTKIRAGIATPQGELLDGSIVTLPTQVNEGRETALSNLEKAVRGSAEATGVQVADLAGLGIGSPGPLYLEKGMIGEAPNLGDLQNCPLKAEMESRLGIPAYLNNDANVFVLGEARYGAGRGFSIVYGVTLGTGFGNGLVLNGEIFNGATGTAAEVWCSPYRDGIIEDYVSGSSVRRYYREQSGLEAEPKEIAERALSGDKAARKAWKEFGRHLGNALAWVVNILDPHVVVVGGSISSQFDLFRETMEERFRRNVNRMPREHCQTLAAELGDNAPLLGAAALVKS